MRLAFLSFTKCQLFGFDRTREISTQSAQAIAAAGKVWGQNHTSVVTIQRIDSTNARRNS